MTGLPPDLAAVAAAHHGTLVSSDLHRLAVTTKTLRRLVDRGVLVRAARGAYVDAEAVRAASPEEKHRLRVIAVARSWPVGRAVSHDSAAVLHGLPLLQVPRLVHGTRVAAADGSPVSDKAVANAVSVLHGGQAVLPTETIAECTVVAAAEAAFGVAAQRGVEAGLVTLDGALHRTAEHTPGQGGRRPGLVYPDELAVLRHELRHHPGQARFRQVCALADPLCESPGESRTRWVLVTLGYRVRSQVEIRDAAGRLAGRVDFVLEEDKVAIEFDGMGKYEEHGQTIAGDKERDQALQRCGYEPVHLLWRHLHRPEAVRAMVEHARQRVRRGRAA